MMANPYNQQYNPMGKFARMGLTPYSVDRPNNIPFLGVAPPAPQRIGNYQSFDDDQQIIIIEQRKPRIVVVPQPRPVYVPQPRPVFVQPRQGAYMVVNSPFPPPFF